MSCSLSSFPFFISYWTNKEVYFEFIWFRELIFVIREIIDFFRCRLWKSCQRADKEWCWRWFTWWWRLISTTFCGWWWKFKRLVEIVWKFHAIQFEIMSKIQFLSAKYSISNQKFFKVIFREISIWIKKINLKFVIFNSFA